MIREMFDDIDRRYDFLNHLFSLCLDYRWRKVMVRELLPLEGTKVLDLATGTGDSARDLVEKGFEVAGLDMSGNMLLRAKKKIPRDTYMPVLGSGYDLPFRANVFHGITCAFGIRNMHETHRALQEILRVLRKGGKAVFLEFSMPRGILRFPYRWYLKYAIPAIARFLSKKEAYEYLGQSIEGFYGPEEFCRCILDAGFSSCEKFPLSGGLVYIHKAYKG